MSESASSHPSRDVGALEQEASAMQTKLAQLRSLQTQARTQTYLFVLLIVGMFAVFFWLTYSRIRDNFAPAEVEKAVNEHLPQVSPQAKNLLLGAVKNSMPTYKEAITTRMHKVGPEIASSAMTRFQRIPEESGKEMARKLQVSFDRVINKIEPHLQKAFPGLTDETRKAMLADFLSKAIAEENKHLATQMHSLYTNDLIRLNSAIEKLKLPEDVSTHDTAKLERQLIHTLLMLMDHHLMSEEPVTAEDSHVPAPATRPASQALAR